MTPWQDRRNAGRYASCQCIDGVQKYLRRILIFGWAMHLGIRTVVGAAMLAVVFAGGVTGIIAGEQSVKSRAVCERVGGKARPNPYKTSNKEYPFICEYPNKLDRECVRKEGVGWFFDVATRKCEPEDDCLIFGDC